MIPVRIDSNTALTVVSPKLNTIDKLHPIYGLECPACGITLSDIKDNNPIQIALVYVGMRRTERIKKYATGGAVAVHAECAGL